MTPIELTKQYLAHLDLTDEQLREIRDVTDELADIVIRGYLERHTNNKNYEQERN